MLTCPPSPPPWLCPWWSPPRCWWPPPPCDRREIRKWSLKNDATSTAPHSSLNSSAPSSPPSLYSTPSPPPPLLPPPTLLFLSILSKMTSSPPSLPLAISQLKEACCYQNRWIFRKVPNGLSPPSFSENVYIVYKSYDSAELSKIQFLLSHHEEGGRLEDRREEWRREICWRTRHRLPLIVLVWFHHWLT